MLQGPGVNWWAVRDTIRDLVADTCFIFDRCFAGSLALGDDNGGELIAASGWDGTATASLQWSFTQVLIDTLKDFDGAPQTLAQIYATIFRQAQRSQIRACPIHVTYLDKPSITFSPLSKLRVIGRSTKNRPEAVVMMRARIRADIPYDPVLWKAWLTQNIPPDVVEAGVTIEAASIGSYIVIFNLPVEVWTMLP